MTAPAWARVFSIAPPSSRWCPGDKAEPATISAFSRSMPVRSIITSPANGAKFAAGTKELKLRGAAWAGDLVGEAASTSRPISAPAGSEADSRQAEEQI